METIDADIGMSDLDSEENIYSDNPRLNVISYGLPSLISVFVIFGILSGVFTQFSKDKPVNLTETNRGEIKNAGNFNILSEGDILSGIKDTVYTDKESWLELKINEQTLYQHWRDGRIDKYLISSGNNKSGDPEALESRPGLFSIFVKEEHHKSSQFNASNMYHFMPFNQGIGFHSIDGTQYYAHLGVRPSSHGCIRMRHEDAKKLYESSELGTLVLASKEYTARTVAFAPPGLVNKKVYTKDEYKTMLASNLYNIIKGRYFLVDKEIFIVDPKVIPVSGVYVSYDMRIPDKQIIPRSYVTSNEKRDKVRVNKNDVILNDESSEELIKSVSNYTSKDKEQTSVPDEVVKKYFNNPIGVLPYFGPKR